MRGLIPLSLLVLWGGPLKAAEPTHPGIERVEIPRLPSPPRKERILKWLVRSLIIPSGGRNLFVVVPYVTVDPNSGFSEGVMPVLVIQGNRQNVEHILAPSLTYNNVFRLTGTMRHYYYPRQETSIVTFLSKSQRTNGQATLHIEDQGFIGRRLFLLLDGGRNIDGANRFFGFGPRTRVVDESDFALKESRLTAGAGWHFTRHLRLTLYQRYRAVNIDNGTDPDIEDTVIRHPTLFGLAPTTVFSTVVNLSYDTRDYATTPTRGTLTQVFTERAEPGALGANTEFQRYGVQCRVYLPHSRAGHVAVVRGAFDTAYGRRLPFYEQAQAGGFDTLRGYPEGRFIDRGRLLLNVEERFSLAAFPILGITTYFEVGPFLSLGTVSPRWQTMRRRDMKFAAGGFLRAVVRPTVVGTLELGFANEGPAGFVDVGYPF